MNILNKQIIKHEGIRLFPYKCPANKITIGIGRNLEDNGITMDEALYLFENDINKCKMELIYFDWFNQLNEVRKGVLIELVFNIGLTKTLKFIKMIKAIIEKDFDKAAIELLDSKWKKQVGKTRANNMAYRLKYGEYET